MSSSAGIGWRSRLRCGRGIGEANVCGGGWRSEGIGGVSGRLCVAGTDRMVVGVAPRWGFKVR